MKAKKISILLVEDDKLAQKMAVIILKQLDCHVSAVNTSRVALESIKTQAFDLIIADVGLPDIDGFSLVERIKKNPSPNQQVPIIMLSAHSDEETISRSYEAGASEFFVKPLNKEVGLDILRKYINEHINE